MTKNSGRKLAPFLTALLLFSCHGSQQDSNLSTHDPVNWSELYWSVCREHHIDTRIEGTPASSFETTPGEAHYDSSFASTIVEIQGPVNMVFDATTKKVRAIFNLALSCKLSAKEVSIEQLKSERPSLVKEDVLARAWEHLRSFLNADVISSLTLESIKFFNDDPRSAAVQRVYSGTWTIRWTRSLKGFRYMNDEVKIILHEEHGLYGFSNFCESESCSTDVFLELGDADRVGKEFAGKIIGSAEYKRWFKNHVLLEGLVSSELVIANPNYLLTDKSTWGHGVGTRKARLAFVLTYKAHYQGPPLREGWIPDTSIFVWVDAQTGEILGGDFQF